MSGIAKRELMLHHPFSLIEDVKSCIMSAVTRRPPHLPLVKALAEVSAFKSGVAVAVIDNPSSGE